MKTTMDIDDNLLIEAKEMAVRRRTTLKAIVEHALRREIHPSKEFKYGEADKKCFEVNEHGIPQLKREGTEKVTSKMVYDIMEKEGI